MAKRKIRMAYRVNPAYLGIRLEDGAGSYLLDENTPQEVLARLHPHAQLYIDIAPAQAVAQIQDNGKAGQ